MIVIPMAGLSRRFSFAGYTQPKYMLDLHGQSLFAHAVGSFRAYFRAEAFLFIARDEHQTGSFLATELAKLGIHHAQTVLLPGPTLGQADTVRLGLQQASVQGTTPLTIFNIDTFRPGFRYPDAGWMSSADGYLEVMLGSDPGFSYVLPGENDQVIATAEKQVLSNLASTGLYWFRKTADFLEALASQGEGAHNQSELYVAPLYNALIARGSDVRYQLVSASDVIFCGLPEQYETLLAGRIEALVSS